LLIFALLWACGGNTTIAVRNAPPEAVWLSPNPAAVLSEGAVVTWRAAVSDADGDPASLRTAWFVNDVAVCEDAEVVDGEAACAEVVPSAFADVRLEVRDPGDAAVVVRQRFDVLPNARPTIDWRSPEVAGSARSDLPVVLEVAVADAEDASELLNVVWTSDVQGVLGTAPPRSEDGVARLVVPFVEGWHDLTAVVTDTRGGAAAVSATLHVRPPNTTPSCGWVTPDEGAVWVVGSTQRVEAFGADADADGPALWGRWTSDRDGLIAEGPLDGAGLAVASAMLASPGLHVLTWEVTDPDGAVCLARRAVEVGTRPTVQAVAPVEGAILRAGAPSLVEVQVADQESLPQALSLRWLSDRDGLVGTATPGEDGRAFATLPGLSPGWHALTVVVTDPTGLAASLTRSVFANQPPTAPIFDAPPVMTVTSEVTLAPSLSSMGVDPEGVPVTLLWSWSLGGLEAATGINAVDASVTEKGQRWLVSVVASDGFHESDPASVIIDVVNQVPSVIEVGTQPDQARVGDSLLCSASLLDFDGDSWVEYAWFVGDVWVGDGPFYRVGMGGESRGADLRCEATAVDDVGVSEPLGASVVVVNAPPRILGVSLGAGVPRAGDRLSCEVLGAIDDDQDPVEVTLRWSVNGATSGYGETFDGTFVAGDVVSCAATAFDGIERGPEVGASVVVANAAPQVFDVTVTPSDPQVGETAACGYRVVDRDRDDPDVFAVWTRDGVPLAQGFRYLVTDRDPVGTTLRCEITAVDAAGATATGAADAAVRNTPPTLNSVTIAPTSPRSDSLLVAVANGGDVNRQALAWRYVWSVDGVVVSDGPEGSLHPAFGAFARGDVVQVWVEVSDGLATASATSLEVQIGNALPTAPGVALIPEQPVPGERLICQWETPAYDADGDALTYVVTWTRDGVPWVPPSGPMQEVPEGWIHEGEVWSCIVQADDGEGLGPPATAAVEVVAP
jgi:hypothetical protein